MSEWNEDGDAKLDAELARLRSALGELRASANGEEALRAAFRARRAGLSEQPLTTARAAQHRDRSASLARSRAGSRRRALFAAGALAASLAVAAVVLVGLGRMQRDAAEITAAPAAGEQIAVASSGEREIPAAAAFQPLLYSPGISPTQAYNVVRVRIPLTSLVGYGAPVDGAIEADLLIGEDGLPTGIRFDTADAPLVSMVTH
ncbi:MAG TPA: hypothetical protein VIC71_01670 [Gammaproteobacteria bacterium]